MGRIINAVISAALTVYYRVSEPIKLIILRDCFELDYHGVANRNPLVSVYVPTHNRADLLMERSLKSILLQTYKNLEIVVVADNCSDDTIERVRALDPKIRVIENRRKKSFPHKAENYWFAGRVDPANAGLDACTGDWIATNDDDDVWLPDHVEQLLRFAQKGNYEFVSGGSTKRGTNYNRTVPIPPYSVNGVLVGGIQTWLYRSYLKSFKFNRQCWRKRWNRVCDTELQDRFVLAGVRMGYFKETVTEIVTRPGETDIGLKAYVRDSKATEQHFAF